MSWNRRSCRGRKRKIAEESSGVENDFCDDKQQPSKVNKGKTVCRKRTSDAGDKETNVSQALPSKTRARSRRAKIPSSSSESDSDDVFVCTKKKSKRKIQYQSFGCKPCILSEDDSSNSSAEDKQKGSESSRDKVVKSLDSTYQGSGNDEKRKIAEESSGVENDFCDDKQQPSKVNEGKTVCRKRTSDTGDKEQNETNVSQALPSKTRARSRRAKIPCSSCESDSDDVFVCTKKKSKRKIQNQSIGCKPCILSEDDSSNSSDEDKQRGSESSRDKGVKSLDSTYQDSDNDVDPNNLVKNNTEPPSEFYDFSSIMQSQQELKDIERKLTVFKKDSTFLKENEENLESDNVLKMLKLCEKNSKAPQEVGLGTGNDEGGLPSQVEIIIKEPEKMSKDCKRRQLLETLVKKEYNEERRSIQFLMHKVHVLCLLAHGFYLNRIVNDQAILALSMSLIPSDKFFPPSPATSSYIEKVLNWYNNQMVVDRDQVMEKKLPLGELIINEFATRKVGSFKNLVLIFVSLTRVLGLKSRILLSLQAVPIKPPASELMKGNSKAKKKSLNDEQSSDDDLDDDFLDVSEPSSSKPLKQISKPERSKTKDVPEKINSSKKTSNNVNRKKSEKVKPKNTKVKKSIDDPTANPSKTATKQGIDIWAEVYVESENRWISVDVVRNNVDCVTKLAKGCTKPITYIISWDNEDNVKDLTRRYAPRWLTSTQKLRVDPSWWKEAIRPWIPKSTKREIAENKELDRLVQKSPLPTAISDYKGHPYFALKRHLLKYEAIYPPDAKPIGFAVNNQAWKAEPVYSRLCVSELHGRETWMRQGKVVRLKEEPYKIVKARPKYDKMSGKTIKDLPLNLYGYWQVEDYIAPPAVDGKVPRNEYGNVELYKPSMLPPGTVHLEVPGMMKIAKRLNIDCAQAVVGWEFHSGGSHPIFNGVIVCKEFQDTLLDTWNKEIDESAERAKYKARKRATTNWKKLIRLVIVKKRLEKKYNFNMKR